jgi:hypothetical protein
VDAAVAGAAFDRSTTVIEAALTNSRAGRINAMLRILFVSIRIILLFTIQSTESEIGLTRRYVEYILILGVLRVL